MVDAAHAALDQWGFGLASVRFICGTQEIHRELEQRLAAFLGTEDAILFGSCFDANTGLFEVLLADRRRGDLGRAQPRVDHRRHPALSRPSGCATGTATWPIWRRSFRRRPARAAG